MRCPRIVCRRKHTQQPSGGREVGAADAVSHAQLSRTLSLLVQRISVGIEPVGKGGRGRKLVSRPF